jgi:hypothetical protein
LRAGRSPPLVTGLMCQLLQMTSRELVPMAGRNHFTARRSHPETNQCSHPLNIKKWDAIMLSLILNAIYRHFLQAALSGISSQGRKL